MNRIVVVGAGLAGLSTLVALRERGYAGRLTLVGGEVHPPYDRPPLSKAVLHDDGADPTLPADWAALDVELLLGRRATGLLVGPDGPCVHTDAGPIAADGLVIATGAAPVQLPAPARATLAGPVAPASVLRTLDDAWALRAALVPGARVVVVGAGWIGAEVATAATAAGCEVVALEAGATPLSGVLPAPLGAVTARWWTEAGVDLRTGVRVAAVEAGCVHLADGQRLAADLVLVGVGVRPATGWLTGSRVPLTRTGAVAVDGGLRTGLPGVLAVGDVAAWQSARYAARLQVEHWDSALHAPAVAAANLLGADETYDPVPYFWSEQFGRMVQYAGHLRGGERLVHRGNPAGDETWSAYWLDGGELVAALAVGSPRDLSAARRILRERQPVDPTRLADPTVPVRAAARTSGGATVLPSVGAAALPSAGTGAGSNAGAAGAVVVGRR